MNTQKYKEILMDACKKEIESIEFYTCAAKKINDSFVKIVFNDIAGIELKHLEMLKELIDKDLSHLKIPEIKIIKQSMRNEIPEINADITAVGAIEIAIKMEENAINYYANLAIFTDNASHKKLYLKLAQIESYHKETFTKTLNDIASWTS